MRVGLVCPYSFDVPGGVQLHVAELAQYLIGRGHQVSVLAPAEGDTAPYVHSAGRAVAVPYNGSVARLAFGPLAATKVRRWLADGAFDLLHLHEPQIPSLSLIALLRADDLPIVATFHTSITRSRSLLAVGPMLRPALEKVLARIAVSEDARRTVVEHLGGDAVVIPNGVQLGRFARSGSGSGSGSGPAPGGVAGPTLLFLGRLDEPRKGLDVLVRAMPAIVAAVPAVRLIVAGRGDVTAARCRFEAVGVAEAVQVLGAVSEAEKVDLLRRTDVYVAPQTGGESFGIVLVEAMAAGAQVVASDLPAFARVLDDGRCGVLFPTGAADGLARAVAATLTDAGDRQRRTTAALDWAQQFDWQQVGSRLLTVYGVASAQGQHPPDEPSS